MNADFLHALFYFIFMRYFIFWMIIRHDKTWTQRFWRFEIRRGKALV
jgi:hypothetical protein